MALSTRNIPTTGFSKTLKPGERMAKLNNITLEADKFNDGGLYLNLHLEGPDLGEGFEGFFIDNDDHSKGRYKGQIGTVKTGQYSYRNAKVGDREINRDEEILKFVAMLGRALGKSAELDAVEADSIEEYIPKAAEVLCKGEEKFLYYTIAGKEYESKGYTNYNLFLPKPDYRSKKYPVSAEREDLLKFDEEKHIIKKKKSEAVDEFAVPSADPDLDIFEV